MAVAVKIRKEWMQKMNWENVPWGTLGCVQKGRESSVIDDDHLLFTLSIQKDAVALIERRESHLGWETFIFGYVGVVLKMQRQGQDEGIQ